MKQDIKSCSETCTCGCREDNKCTCGCEDENCNCDETCACGCQ